jgi:DNA-binding CsgD family transcriptional regulator
VGQSLATRRRRVPGSEELMAGLAVCDIRAVADTLREIYAAADVERFSGLVVNALPKLVPAHRASYNSVSASLRRISWDVSSGTPDIPDAAAILSRHFHEHPVAAHYKRYRESRWITTSELVSLATFRRTSIYNEYYRGMGTEHQIVMMCGMGPRAFLGINLHRGHRDFSAREQALLDVLYPHLVQGHLNAIRSTRLAGEIEGLRRGLEGMEVGIVLLSEGRRVRGASARARRLLAEYFDGSRRRPGELPARLAEWICWHERAMARRGEMPPSRRPLAIQRGGRCLQVRLVGAPGDLMLLLAERHAELPVEALAPLGLSGRETEVLKWVAEGKRDGEIAIILGISPRTVNHHVERICAKLGVENRTAAAACALRAAGQAP